MSSVLDGIVIGGAGGAIASWCNLTEDRVRFLCSLHEGIHLSTGEREDMWGVHPRPDDRSGRSGPSDGALGTGRDDEEG